ncbi:hypothetical protein ACYOEI_38070 [Singulisphaera rosea]
MSELFVIIAFVIGLPILLLGLREIIVPPPAQRQYRLWQIGAVILLSGLLFATFTSGPNGGPYLFLAGLFVVGFFAWSWRQEFLHLMSLRDEEFAGKYDKLVWALLLIAMPPVGLWFFRASPLARRPEPARAATTAKPMTARDFF